MFGATGGIPMPTKPLMSRAGWMRDRAGALIALGLPLAAFAVCAAIGLAREEAFSHSYTHIARNLVDLGLYSRDGVNPTAYRPPLYPLFLGASMLLAGERWATLAILLQAGLAGLCVALVVLIANRLFASRAVAALAGVLVVLHAPLLSEFVRPRETGLFCVLVLAWFLLLAGRRADTATAAALAVVSGLALLTRPSGILLLPLSAAILLIFHRAHMQRRIGDLLLYGIVAAAVLAPWQIYLYGNFGVLSLSGSSSAGVNLFKGNHPVMGNIVPALDVDQANPTIVRMLAAHGLGQSDAHGLEWQRDAWLRDQAVGAMRADPAGFLSRTAWKALLFLAPVRVPLGDGEVRMTEAGVLAVADFKGPGWRGAPYVIIGLPIVPFGLCGLFLAAAIGGPARHWAVGALLFIGANIALYAVTFPETRLRYPLDPLLIIGTAWLAVTGGRRLLAGITGAGSGSP